MGSLGGAGDRVQRFVIEASRLLSRARTAAEVAEAACRIGTEAMEASAGALWLRGPDGSLSLAGASGTGGTGDEEMPAVIQTVRAIWIETEEDYASTSPAVYARAKAAGRLMAYGAVPLSSGTGEIGVIVFSHPLPHVYDGDERAFHMALALHCSQALERARLLDAERRANERLHLLARMSEELAGVIDVHESFSRVARMVVPAFADMVAVFLLEGDALRRVIVEHRDPDRSAALQAAVPVRLEDRRMLRDLLASGRTNFRPSLTDEILQQSAGDDAQLEAMRSLSLRSSITVPVSAAGQPVGVVVFLTAESGRRYDEGDRDFAQEIARRVGAAIDRVRLYVTAQEQARRAEAASRVKDELLAIVSHELRTPLNAITGWVQMLRSGVLTPEKQAHALTVIERNAKAQEQLISDLLDVSRVISGRLRLNVSEVDLARVIGMAADAVRPSAARKGVALEIVSCHVDEPVAGDVDRLQQVVWNLLTNAVKFTPAGGRVEMSLETRAPHAVITVRDTGPGIRPELLEDIFEPFRQGDGTFARRHGGLGLGLAITRTLVQMHGGTVEAHSAGEGTGAAFMVRLPLASLRPDATPRVPAVAGPTSAMESDQLRGKSILVVEDEPDSRELLLSLLEECGARVVGASSAAEAIERFQLARTELIVSDIGLPGEDGLSLLRRIRRAPGGAGVRAVALTAFARQEDRDRALEAGFDRHMAKPIDAQQFLACLTELARST